jgi:hypothetical protein
MGFLALVGLLRLNLDLGWGPFNIALFGLVFGPGLFMRRSWARKGLIWLTYFGFLIVAFSLVGIVQWSPRSFRIALSVVTVIVTLLVIQLVVLMDGDVRQYYQAKSNA